MADRHRQIEELFHAVLELQPSEREAFLSRACASDPTLRSEIEALVSAHEQDKTFLNSSAYDLAGGVSEKQPNRFIGTVIVVPEALKGKVSAEQAAAFPGARRIRSCARS